MAVGAWKLLGDEQKQAYAIKFADEINGKLWVGGWQWVGCWGWGGEWGAG